VISQDLNLHDNTLLGIDKKGTFSKSIRIIIVVLLVSYL